MSAAKLQAAFETFHGRFLHPLLVGAKVETARPLAPGVLDHFALARPSDPDEEHDVLVALSEQASALAPIRRLDWPTRGAMALAIACDDLVTLTDEELSARARRVIATWVEELVARAGAPASRSDALARHVVVSRVAELRREDVVVKNWAYTHRFFGRPVPKRVTVMPALRRVKVAATTRLFGDVLARLHGWYGAPALWRTLVARSPVTELVDRALAPTFVFSQASIAVLADGALRSGIARQIAADPERDAQARALGTALLALHPEAPPASLYFALALVYEVHVTTLLERDAPTPGAGALDATRAFAAVLPAVTRTGLPCGAERLAPHDRERVAQAAKALAGGRPTEVTRRIDALAGRARDAMPALAAAGLA